jgi:hypothetical protein
MRFTVEAGDAQLRSLTQSATATLSRVKEINGPAPRRNVSPESLAPAGKGLSRIP